MNDAEAIHEVFAERPFGDHVHQIAIRRRDDAHIDQRRRSVRPDGLNLAILQEPQQQGLHAKAGFSNFIKKQRSAMCRVKRADLVTIGPGKAALHVPEELALEERLCQPGAVDRDKPMRRSR